MSLADAAELNTGLLNARGSPMAAALRDALWLRTALMEQWRRTPASERKRFEVRANRLLQRSLFGSAEERGCAAFHPIPRIPWGAMTSAETDTLLLSVKEVSSALGISV